jgi:adenosine deaminase
VLELAPRGIGHGVHALESPATLERLAREGVTLEVCPTSNHLLIPTALSKLKVHTRGLEPLPALQRAHVHCVLGSDDPTPMGTTFPQELDVARRIGVDLERLEADMLRRWAEMTGAPPLA